MSKGIAIMSLSLDGFVADRNDGVAEVLGSAPCSPAGARSTSRQLLNTGFLDELDVDASAVLLGSGVRLFGHLARTPAVLGNPNVIAGVGVTHLRYSVKA